MSNGPGSIEIVYATNLSDVTPPNEDEILDDAIACALANQIVEEQKQENSA
jgi:hypothetical protein